MIISSIIDILDYNTLYVKPFFCVASAFCI